MYVAGSRKRSRATPIGGSQGLQLAIPARARGRRTKYTYGRRKAPMYKRLFGGARFATPDASTRLVNSSSASHQTIRVNKTNAFIQYTGVGGGTAFQLILTPTTQQAPGSASYGALFTRMKVHSIKLIAELITMEQSDDALLPQIAVRYNHDPDLAAAALNFNYFNNLKDVGRKTLNATDNRIEYTMYPQILQPGYQLLGLTAQAIPKPCPWIDATSEIALYGFQFYVGPFGSGQTILVSLEWDVSYSEPK